MPDATTTLSADYFEKKYARTPDPWSFSSSRYERAKYQHTVAALAADRYGRAFEAGCSIGELTRLLAARVNRLVATDISPRAIATARERCADLPQIEFRVASLPDECPAGLFDLVVLSEVAYYLCWHDLERLRGKIANMLAPGGHLLLVHYTPVVEDYPLTGDEVHDFFTSTTFRPLVHSRQEFYRLDLTTRAV